MVTALRMIGFDKVFDTNYGADLTITEEANELIERIKSGQKMPMATSCCPGWVNYVEKHYPDLLDYLSTTKSPMQIFSAITKTHYAQQEHIDPKKSSQLPLCHVLLKNMKSLALKWDVMVTKILMPLSLHVD